MAQMQPLATGQNPNVNNIGALAVDPANLQTIYAGTGEANFNNDGGAGAGILKSTDGGDHWVIVSRGPSNAFVGQSISKIILTPGGIFAAVVPTGANAPTADDGVYKRSDGGLSWTKQTVGFGLIIPTDLAFANGKLYAGLGNPLGITNWANYSNIGAVGIYSSSYTGGTEAGGVWLGWDAVGGTNAPYSGMASEMFGTAGPIGRVSLAASPDGTALYVAVASPQANGVSPLAFVKKKATTPEGHGLTSFRPTQTKASLPALIARQIRLLKEGIISH